MDRSTVSRARIRLPILALAASLLFAFATPVSAQYFGRNKVQYKTFKFQILKTEHFDVYFYPEERAAAEQAGRMAERWYTRLSQLMKHDLEGRQPLILYGSHPEFEQTNVIQGELDESTGGVTEFLKRRIVLPLAGTLAESDHVIGHELVHAFQYDITRQSRTESGVSEPVAARLPLWFIEGMAEYLSIGAEDPNTTMWIRDAAEVNRLPRIRKLTDPRFFPYRYGQALWAYVGGRWGDEAVGEALKSSGRAADADMALRRVIGIAGDTLSHDWHESIRAWYAAIKPATEPATDFGRVLIKGEPDQGRLNVAPSLSPDGSRLMFLSERSLFSIELFLADARTGKIIRSVTQTAVDPHFQSLQFIQSAGAWSPDGKEFAFAAISDGSPVLTVIDVDRNRTVKEIKLPQMGEIFTPSWAPDGKRLVFSAITGGATDLFIVDLGSGKPRRLTNDLYAELQPAWSPDGKRIAFATDRFTSKIDDLSFGPERLATIDPETGDVHELGGNASGKNINPQWSADGRTLYFVSDFHGIPNVYRMDADGGSIRQVTNVRTGVSGITRLSPALSVARDADAAVFSMYEDGSYSLYRADAPEALAGHAPAPAFAGADPGVLPPADRKPSEVARLTRLPTLGLTAPAQFQRTPYRARLSLDLVSQTNAGVSAGTNGLAVGGGTTLYWSDVLGNHNLATLIQVSNEGGSVLNNLATIVAYDNRKSRWNWGLTGAQVPSLTRALQNEEVVVNGEPLLVQRDYRFWEIDRQLALNLSYPLNRVRRIELSAGYLNIDFNNEVEQSVYSEVTGELLEQQTTSLGDSLSSLNLATASAALVHDTSVFGGTSPLLGQRFRLELSPVAGDLTYVGALADVRSYFMILRPLSLATRVIHYGRYGKGGEDSRLSDLFVGQGWLVRGYDSGSFSLDECATGDCSEFNRLFGSRLGVANVELRFPLLGALGLIRSPSIPPVEAAAFYDAGVAWTREDKASFLGGDRDPVTSWGGAFRFNLLGFAIAEFAFVHPNDRPQKGWYWQFGLQPGF